MLLRCLFLLLVSPMSVEPAPLRSDRNLNGEADTEDENEEALPRAIPVETVIIRNRGKSSHSAATTMCI